MFPGTPVDAVLGQQPTDDVLVQRLGVGEHAIHVEDDGVDGAAPGQIGRLPWMIRMSTITMAMMSST